jgi:hypothetical protein
MKSFSFVNARRGTHHLVLELKSGQWLAQVTRGGKHTPEGWSQELVCENVDTVEEALGLVGRPVDLFHIPAELTSK